MRLKALIFDVDGTLADTEAAHCAAFNDAFAAAGLAWRWDAARYRVLLRVTGGKERIMHFIDTLPLAESEKAQHRARVPALHADKTRRYAQRVAAGRVGLRPGIERLLTEARGAGVRLALATTTSPQNVEALIDATLGPAARTWFSSRVCGDAVANKKPAPDAYLRALSELGLRATDCVALEDSANGLRAARAAGLCTIVTPTDWSAAEDFADAALVLPHLGDAGHALEGADARRAGGPWLGLASIERIRAVHDDHMEATA
ncbi:MAG: hypothetical protein AMJ64_11035 [Betaproteobacteria bacterium SG8_39]|nr:MAG: hypothetical protein AMJ64_11035 [Betaproteobacteria bacterium SG8_39]